MTYVAAKHPAPVQHDPVTPLQRAFKGIQRVDNNAYGAAALAVAHTFRANDKVGFMAGAGLVANGARNLVNLFSGDDKQSFIGNAGQVIGGGALIVAGLPGALEASDKAMAKSWAIPLVAGGLAYNAVDRHVESTFFKGGLKGAIVGAAGVSVVVSAERGAVTLAKEAPYGLVIGALVGGTIGFIADKCK